MKKYLIIIVLFFCAFNIYGQHISFMGVQLGQSESVIDRMLRQKGFRYVGVNNVVGTRMYNGKFWKFEDTTINTEVESGKVTGILVGPSYKLYTRVSDYNNLVQNLNKKYGKGHPISNFFKYSDIARNSGLYWKISGGYIVAYYTTYTKTHEIKLYYLDNSNKRILLEKGRRRNTNDDL